MSDPDTTATPRLSRYSRMVCRHAAAEMRKAGMDERRILEIIEMIRSAATMDEVERADAVLKNNRPDFFPRSALEAALS